MRGQRLDDTQLWELIDGLEANGLDNYSHIINGYIGKDTFLLKLGEVIKKLKVCPFINIENFTIYRIM